MPSRARSNRRLGDVVAVADRVEAVVERAGEAELGGGERRVERQRRAGQRAGAERRDVEALDRGQQPVDVAGQRPAVGQQVVGQQHRLGALQVGVARQVGVAGVHGALQQHLLQVDDASGDVAQRGLHHSRRSVAHWSLRLRPVCSLAPAAPAIAVTRRSIAVWMSSSLRHELERAGGQLGLDLVERGEDVVALVVGEQADVGEAAHVGARAGDVLAPHQPVERQADGERQQLLARAALEAPVPQRAHRRTVTLSRSLRSLMRSPPVP